MEYIFGAAALWYASSVLKEYNSQPVLVRETITPPLSNNQPVARAAERDLENAASGDPENPLPRTPGAYSSAFTYPAGSTYDYAPAPGADFFSYNMLYVPPVVRNGESVEVSLARSRGADTFAWQQYALK